MKTIKLIQRKLEHLIKVYVSSTPVDIGRFSVYVIQDDVEKLGRDLNIEFDEITIYPGPQPRESGDIEFYLNKKRVKKISLKTAVTGNLKLTFRKLWNDMMVKEQDGLLLTVLICKQQIQENDEIKEQDITKLLVIYVPYACTDYSRSTVYNTIVKMLKDKAQREQWVEFRPLAINDAINFEHLRRILILEDHVSKLEDHVSKLDNAIMQLKESNKEIDKKIGKILEMLENKKGEDKK